MNLRARFFRTAFSQINKKVTAYALNKVIKQIKRLKPSLGQKKEINLLPYTYLFRFTYGLFYAHEIKFRINLAEPLKIKDFHSYWWFNKDTVKNARPESFERVLNPNMVKVKGRSLRAPNKKKSNKVMSTIKRDSSQHEVVLAAVTENGS
jgi:hypothetical protein